MGGRWKSGAQRSCMEVFLEMVGREVVREVGRTRVSGERLFDTELGIRVSVEQPSNP